MTQREIRALVHAAPFQPFRLHLLDKRVFRIPHPDFILLGTRMAVVANESAEGAPEKMNLVPYQHIARVEMLPRRSRKRS